MVVVTRRSVKAGGSGGHSSSQASAATNSLRATLARLSLSGWVGVAAFLFMLILGLLGPRSISNPAVVSLTSSFMLTPMSETTRRATAPKPMSRPCSSTQLAPWPLGVEFTRAKSDAGVKCLDYAYTVSRWSCSGRSIRLRD
jgi:hypothetical protein